MKYYLYTFTITPTGLSKLGATVPFDMLRYDACFPLGSQDAARLEAIARREGAQPVNLGAYHQGAQWKPEEGRWQSFGWTTSDLRRGI